MGGHGTWEGKKRLGLGIGMRNGGYSTRRFESGFHNVSLRWLAPYHYRYMAHAVHALHAGPHSSFMYIGFFSHSPCAAHATHCELLFTHAFRRALPTPNAPTCIHLVADHLTPFTTGHAPCRLVLSSSPSAVRL